MPQAYIHLISDHLAPPMQHVHQIHKNNQQNNSYPYPQMT
jgi:hypothetical protein